MKITIESHKLHDALMRVVPFAATDKHLPELNAVRVIPSESGALTIVATNRYTLAERIITDGKVEDAESGGFTVPLDMAKQWLKTIKPFPPGLELVIEYQANEPYGNIALSIDGQTIGGPAVPGKWVPNYARLFPAEAERKDATVPFVALGAFALRALTEAFPEKLRDGTNSATFRFAFVHPNKSVTVTTPSDDQWRALIMTRRTTQEGEDHNE